MPNARSRDFCRLLMRQARCGTRKTARRSSPPSRRSSAPGTRAFSPVRKKRILRSMAPTLKEHAPSSTSAVAAHSSSARTRARAGRSAVSGSETLRRLTAWTRSSRSCIRFFPACSARLSSMPVRIFPISRPDTTIGPRTCLASVVPSRRSRCFAKERVNSSPGPAKRRLNPLHSTPCSIPSAAWETTRAQRFRFLPTGMM